MLLSRLTERIDPAAFKVALRTAIFMPVCFALATLFLDGRATPFAAFGSFIILAMVTFAGRPGPRFWAWLALVLAGCALIALGTYLSTRVNIAGVLVAGVVSFLIFFLGVVNPYIAAARNGAVLLLALPLMIEAPDAAIDDRLSGWLLAAVICIPATYLLWRLPWTGELRRQSARVCAALARLARDPGSESLREAAREKVWTLRRRFVATPHRPTGATGVSAAIASLVEELGWLHGLITIPGAGIDADGFYARRLRSAVADLLEASSQVLNGEAVPLPVAPVTGYLDELVENSATELIKVDRAGIEVEARQLEHEFRLRKVAYAALDLSRMVEIATERERAPGLLGRAWTWFTVRSRRQVRETGRIVTEHSALSSSWFQNSIRGAIGIALAVWMADLLSVQNAFWVVLGTLSVLRNNAIGTRGSVARALAGTMVGILIGTLVIALIGDSTVLLWIALPLSVLFAAYAPRALSLAAGQAGFAVLVMVLYNLIEPVGWQVAIIRIQDVAVGCGVSLVVGLLIWPRGATALIRHALAESLRAGSELVKNRGLAVLDGRPGDNGPDWEESLAASDRLDAALRQYLDETSGEQVDPEALMALAAAGLRLRRVADGLGLIPEEAWFEIPDRDSSPGLELMICEVTDWYSRVGEAIELASPPPAPLALDPQLPHELISRLESGGTGPESPGAGIARIWIYENFAYLAELSVRFNQHARALFHARRADEVAGQPG
ncbi:MAG: FUSC family protein [Solirubrobacterales bacterium]|nr:FUSC family protein [Solirubrobacterales bacterium]MCB8915991.1 FUSC family protein [Thermoleophilales bacterium]